MKKWFIREGGLMAAKVIRKAFSFLRRRGLTKTMFILLRFLSA
jgi:hypothetical protein